jgi:hypothetical protein
MLKTFVAIGLLVGSYLMAALVNASPVTQPGFRSTGRVRVIVVVPQTDVPSVPSPGSAETLVPGDLQQQSL